MSPYAASFIAAVLFIQLGTVDELVIAAVLCTLLVVLVVHLLIKRLWLAHNNEDWDNDDNDDNDERKEDEIDEVTPEEQRYIEIQNEKIAIAEQEDKSMILDEKLAELKATRETIAKQEELNHQICNTYEENMLKLKSKLEQTTQQLQAQRQQEKAVNETFKKLHDQKIEISENLKECERQIELIESNNVQKAKPLEQVGPGIGKHDGEMEVSSDRHEVELSGSEQTIEKEAKSIDQTELQLAYFKKEKGRLEKAHHDVSSQLENITQEKFKLEQQRQEMEESQREVDANAKEEMEKIMRCKGEIEKLQRELEAMKEELHGCKETVETCMKFLQTKYSHMMSLIVNQLHHLQKSHKIKYGYKANGCDHASCRKEFRALKADQKKYNDRKNVISHKLAKIQNNE